MMVTSATPHTFGPVPSRRLGRSLGINNIPPKRCTYACVYCQLGKGGKLRFEREPYYRPEALYAETGNRLEKLAKQHNAVDYLTIVPDGEPTLDSGLGSTIALLKKLGYPVAVITNASLLWRPDVREDLLHANLVSIKADVTEQSVWRILNRPHGKIRLDRVLEGIIRFANNFDGDLITETMLIKGINDKKGDLEWTAQFLSFLKPKESWIAIPTRPTADSDIKVPSERKLNQAYQIFSSSLASVKFLTGDEGDAFEGLSDGEQELLNIVSVHPMRLEAARKYLARFGDADAMLESMLRQQKIVKIPYRESSFLLRKLKG